MSEKIICNQLNQIFNINTNEVHFIESPKFPQSMSVRCSINFIGQNYANPENLRMIFVVTNGVLPFHSTILPFEDPNFYIINGPEFLLNITGSNSYIAFQGMIMLQDWGSYGCPFEPVAYYNPFEFKDISQIFYLGRDISRIPQGNDGETFITNCKWRFSAPKGYHFKISVYNWGNDTGKRPKSNLNITTSNGDVTSMRPGLTSTFHYIDSSEITISYYNLHEPNDFYDYGDYFYGYVSIYKTGSTVTEIKCNTTKINDNKTTIWTNIDQFKTGYKNNVKCSLNLTIPVKHAFLVEPKTNIMEIFDTVFGYVGTHVIDLRNIVQLGILQAHENGYNNDLFWEFKSDGSIQSLGFEIVFTEIECKCGPDTLIVPCSGEYKTNIMNNDNDLYCNDLQCNFMLIMDPGCNTSFIMFEIGHMNMGYGDYFKIISNENILFEYYTEGADPPIEYLLSSSNQNIFQFVSSAITTETLHPKAFYMKVSAVEKPSVNPSIILTEEKPLHIFLQKNMPLNSLLTIKFDEKLKAKNDTFEVIFDTQNFNINLMFYIDENLTTLASDKTIIPSSPNPTDDPDIVSFSYYITTKTVTIYKFKDFDSYTTVVLRAKETHSKNCYFENSVYKRCQASEVSTYESYFGMVARESGVCEVIILTCFLPGLDENNQLTAIWTTSRNETIKMCGKNDNLLMEFTQKDAHFWKNILLTSMIFTIQIPPGSTINLIFSGYEMPIIIDTYPYKTVWISPFYGFDVEHISEIYTYSILNNIVVTFTVLEAAKSINTFVTVNIDSTSYITINEIGQSFDVSFDVGFSNVTITYNQYGPSSRVVIGIETKKQSLPQIF